LTVKTGDELSPETIAYLGARLSKLDERSKVVVIIMDEVYSAKHVEFCGGKLYGQENGQVTKTLFCTMLKSVSSNYSDVVTLTEIVNINAQKMNDIFMRVLKSVTSLGFSVVGSLVDGYSTNIKFYKNALGQGTMPLYIPHPYDAEEKLFLLFDSVHIFKCLFTNFLNKKEFMCPSFDDFSKTIHPKFSHLRQIANMELGKPIKFAPRLNDKSLAPMPIERSNVKLASNIFHESTVSALRHYATEHPEYLETAQFLQTIRTWFDICNVRTPFVGIQKRDQNKTTLTLDNEHPREFFRKFSAWLDVWRATAPRNLALSNETFGTSQQTTLALPALANYLLEKKQFHYVLLGKIQSDALEGRFGYYRSLTGVMTLLSKKRTPPKLTFVKKHPHPPMKYVLRTLFFKRLIVVDYSPLQTWCFS